MASVSKNMISILYFYIYNDVNKKPKPKKTFLLSNISMIQEWKSFNSWSFYSDFHLENKYIELWIFKINN